MEISEEELVRIQEKVEKLKQSKFKQQMLPAWRPVPSFGSTMIIFGIFGVIFLTLGITLYIMSDKIQDSITQYDMTDNGCGAPKSIDYNEIKNDPEINSCKVTLRIDTDIPAPIYVYYQLENFYQNHRRYVKSRSNDQLLGTNLAVDSTEIKDCDPIITNEQLEFTHNVNGTLLDPAAAAVPCGLVAKSFFNDTFKLFKETESATQGEEIRIDDSDIAWESDVKHKFKNLDGDW